MNKDRRSLKLRDVHVGFKTSIITLFVAIVLFVGLTLVYLSFQRISAMTRTAASTFIEKVAQLGADRIDSQFKAVRDSLEILAGLAAIQSAELVDNRRLYGLMAAMLRNNPHLLGLYVGYADGSFLQMEMIDRASASYRAALDAPDAAVFRLVTILRTGAGTQPPTVTFLSDTLSPVAQTAGPAEYDPRKRPWYIEASRDPKSLLTGPYTFFATGEPGYTLRIPLREGRRGVIAGDILLDETETMLSGQRLGKSGLAFLFNEDDRIIAHPQMAEPMRSGAAEELPAISDVKLAGLADAIRAWRSGGSAQQFFSDRSGRAYLAAFQRIETAGDADIRLAVVAPLDEFYAEIISERRRLFIVAMVFVAASLPFVFWIGSLLARSLRQLAKETDSIQRFELAERPRVRSSITEIDELGRSVFTMRNVVRNFSSFVPKRIVQQLLESGSDLRLGGTRREISVLFTDVSDFTAKTEKADPSEVMLYTSRYFAAMSETVMAHQGTVDKFIGDGMMAFWNAPADDPDHVSHCCSAVLACLRRNDELNLTFNAENWPAYDTRFGLHVGDAVVGNIGSSDRMNYTALGATINLAARLEGLNKSYGTRVLATDAIKARASTDFVFRSVDRIQPKGFAEACTIYELRGERHTLSTADATFIRAWEDVYASIQCGDTTAAARLAAFRRKHPDDGVASYHAALIGGVTQTASA